MQSVIKQPTKNGIWPLGGAESLTLNLASVADSMMPWGSSPKGRDQQLRQFWPNETTLAGAIYTTVSQYVGFRWSLEGPPKTTAAVQRMLQTVDHGKGWRHMMSKVCTDLFTQDNGAFIEVVRASDSPSSPTVTLNHLDSGRCIRTGNWEVPVIYNDIQGKLHEIKYYQILPLEEMPSPIEIARGMQYSAVTRILKAAQLIRDISTYKREKASGRFNRAVHLISGVQSRQINDALFQQSEAADSSGLTHFVRPLIIAALDPTATITHEVLEMASLPDGWDYDTEMRWYITNIALVMGKDYQDFAPLTRGNLGSSQQSQVLHLKSRGKGAALFMGIIEDAFNFQGVLPSTVVFKYGEMDVAQSMEFVELRKARAQERQVRIESGEITTQVARQMALDAGDLTRAEMAMMEEKDQTPDVVLTSGEPPPKNEPHPTDTKPGPDAPPGANSGNARIDTQQEDVTPVDRNSAPAKTDPTKAGKV